MLNIYPLTTGNFIILNIRSYNKIFLKQLELLFSGEEFVFYDQPNLRFLKSISLYYLLFVML